MDMYCTKISIDNLEEFLILTDDIINILRYRKAFYNDKGEPQYFENIKEYQDKISHEDNFIVEKLIHSKKYIDNGLLNCPAEDIFKENLLPLKDLILALYHKGTKADCFYCVDSTFSEEYLLKAVTLRIIDQMLYEAKGKALKKYFLAWTRESFEDMDKWVAIIYTKDELKRYYEKEIDENDGFYGQMGLKLRAYEYMERCGFVPVSTL